MLRFAFRIGNKTDVLLGQIPAMPCLLLLLFSFSPSPPCFECAKASRGSVQLEGGFGKCDEKWAPMCAETELDSGWVGRARFCPSITPKLKRDHFPRANALEVSVCI